MSISSDQLVQQKVDGHFIYVRDIHKSIAMYSKLFGFPVQEDKILFGHLYFLPNGVILDANGMKDRPIPEWLPVSLKLSSGDIDLTKAFVEDIGFEMTHGIDRGPTVSWFLFKDPDGNTLMMCQDY
jgi:predicted enzyme related to lactoylglutathione lyase